MSCAGTPYEQKQISADSRWPVKHITENIRQCRRGLRLYYRRKPTQQWPNARQQFRHWLARMASAPDYLVDCLLREREQAAYRKDT